MVFMERIRVNVDGVSRLFPVEKVKVIEYLPDGGVNVVVIYPSYTLRGTIGEESIPALLAHRLAGNRILFADD
jgi:hypothetical protein